jgi:hypothetical protein
MEQVLDWLNENEIRSFPLLDDSSKTVLLHGNPWILPENFILDLQLIVHSSNLVTNQQEVVPVVMHTIALSNTGEVSVVFSASSQITTFTINSPATQPYPLYLRNADGNLAVFGSGVLDFVAAAQTTTQVTCDIPIEPATCTQFNGPWLGVNSLSTSPEKVSLSPLLAEASRNYEPSLPLADASSSTLLTGDIKLLEGYNFRVNIANNLIDLEIGVGYGLVMNCTTSFIPAEYLDCGDIVSYINGVPPDSSGNFRLLAGSNINITKGVAVSEDFYDDIAAISHNETSNEHSLFVGLNFQSTDICAPVANSPLL